MKEKLLTPLTLLPDLQRQGKAFLLHSITHLFSASSFFSYLFKDSKRRKWKINTRLLNILSLILILFTPSPDWTRQDSTPGSSLCLNCKLIHLLSLLHLFFFLLLSRLSINESEQSVKKRNSLLMSLLMNLWLIEQGLAASPLFLLIQRRGK